MDAFTLILGAPVAFVISAWLGRKFQRMHWNLDLPYEERVKLLRQ